VTDKWKVPDMAENVNTSTIVDTVYPLATHWVKLHPQKIQY